MQKVKLVPPPPPPSPPPPQPLETKSDHKNISTIVLPLGKNFPEYITAVGDCYNQMDKNAACRVCLQTHAHTYKGA